MGNKLLLDSITANVITEQDITSKLKASKIHHQKVQAEVDSD